MPRTVDGAGPTVGDASAKDPAGAHRGVFNLDREVVRTHHDLHAQMTGRKERLSFLIKFINDNSALNKVSSYAITL